VWTTASAVAVAVAAFLFFGYLKHNGLSDTSELAGIVSMVCGVISSIVALLGLAITYRHWRHVTAAQTDGAPAGPATDSAPGRTAHPPVAPPSAGSDATPAPAPANDSLSGLATLLLDIPTVRQPQSWHTVLSMLPAEIANQAPQQVNMHQTALSFLMLMTDHEHGAHKLIDALHALAPGSLAVRRFEGELRRLALV
jgi:hypothetical protein